MTFERPVGLANPKPEEWKRYQKLMSDYGIPTLARIMELLSYRNELPVAKCTEKLFTLRTGAIANSVFRISGLPVRLLPSDETIDMPLKSQIFHLFEIRTEDSKSRTPA